MRLLCLALLMNASAVAATPIISGEAALVQDYRFRGISRSDAGPAITGRLGLEAGIFRTEAFAASLAGWGRFAGADAELTLSAGVRQPLALGTLDLGATLYTFPGAARAASILEAQARLSGTVGPLMLTAGTAWAPLQAGLASATSRRGSNLHLWGAAQAGIIGTPLTVNARIGHSRGRPGLAPAAALAGSARAWDWRLGVDYATGPFLIGAGVAGTDLGGRANALLQTQPRLATGRRLAGTGLTLSLSAGF